VLLVVLAASSLHPIPCSFAMAPKGTKRAQPKGAAPQAKKAKVDPMLEAVQSSIEGADFLPDSCRAMLAAVLNSSLGVPSDERLQTQAMFVEQIAQLMQQSKAKKEEALKAEEQTCEDFVNKKSGLDAKVVEAEASLTTMKELAEAKKALFEEAKKAVANAKQELVAKKEAEVVGKVADSKAQVQSEKLSTAMNNSLAAILSGEGEDKDTLQHYDALKPLLPIMELEDTLKTALPTACAKPFGERGAFDNMAIDALKTAMDQKLAELNKQVQDAEPAAAARKAAGEQAEGTVKTATEQEAAAAEELQTATANLANAQTGLKAAKDKVIQYEPDFQKATAARDEKSEELKQFVQYSMACFETLKEKTAKKPEAEEVTEAKVVEVATDISTAVDVGGA